MAEVYDYMETETGDLLIRGGDFVLTESTSQHEKDILIADKGQYKAFPTVGVGIDSWLNEDGGYVELSKVIQEQLEADGMRIGKMVIKSIDEIEINSEYISDGTKDSIR